MDPQEEGYLRLIGKLVEMSVVEYLELEKRGIVEACEPNPDKLPVRLNSTKNWMMGVADVDALTWFLFGPGVGKLFYNYMPADDVLEMAFKKYDSGITIEDIHDIRDDYARRSGATPGFHQAIHRQSHRWQIQKWSEGARGKPVGEGGHPGDGHRRGRGPINLFDDSPGQAPTGPGGIDEGFE